jgi:hypothetical protein
VAKALRLSCGAWTEDADFFRTGIAVRKTNRIESFLKEAAEKVTSGRMILCDIVDD